jgi:hypothetical protein
MRLIGGASKVAWSTPPSARVVMVSSERLMTIS